MTPDEVALTVSSQSVVLGVAVERQREVLDAEVIVLVDRCHGDEHAAVLDGLQVGVQLEGVVGVVGEAHRRIVHGVAGDGRLRAGADRRAVLGGDVDDRQGVVDASGQLVADDPADHCAVAPSGVTFGGPSSDVHAASGSRRPAARKTPRRRSHPEPMGRLYAVTPPLQRERNRRRSCGTSPVGVRRSR